MGLAEVLTIIFIVLKIVGVISWSWWLVFIPMYVAAGIYLVIFVVWLIGVGIAMKFIK